MNQLPAFPRIVFTGGPGGGKTTAADLIRREFGERLVIVPESATLLFMAGFPRTPRAESVRAAQCAIFHVQHNLEEVQSAHFPDKVLLCDRGTVDGGAYWPDGPDAFFRTQGTTLTRELNRYTAVLFFESAAIGGLAIGSDNRARTESLTEAVAVDARLRSLWSQHPNFHLIRQEASFFAKMEKALAIMRRILSTT